MERAASLEGDKTQPQDAEMTLSTGLRSLDRRIADVTRSLSSSETKCDELESGVTADADSMGLKVAQNAGRLSATQAQLCEFLEACRSAEDTDESDVLRQAHAIMKSINRSSFSASVFVATNIVQTEKTHEVPSIGTATQDTGWVKRWFKDRSFGIITPKDGGEDVYIHWKQLVGTKVLKQEDTVSNDTEHDERKGKCKAVNCIVTPSGGCGKHDCGNDDIGLSFF